MNKNLKYFCLCFIFIAYLQLTRALTLDDAIDTIDDKQVLTGLYCRKFKNTSEVFADEKSLDAVQPDALWNCTEVTHIDLGYNKIKELHPNTFKFNIKLEKLHMYCNRLSFIPSELLKPLINLELLDVSGSHLGTIEPILNSGLLTLKTLVIINIELHELDPDILVKNLPNLKSIFFRHNLIECNAFDAIKTNLSTLGISSMEWNYTCYSTNKNCLTPAEKKMHSLVFDTPKNFTLHYEKQKNLSSQILEIKNQQGVINKTMEEQKQALMNFKSEINYFQFHMDEFSRTLNEKLKINHENLSKNISDTLTNNQITYDETMRTLWLTISLITIGFCLITGYLYFKLFKSEKVSSLYQPRENIVEMDSHI